MHEVNNDPYLSFIHECVAEGQNVVMLTTHDLLLHLM